MDCLQLGLFDISMAVTIISNETGVEIGKALLRIPLCRAVAPTCVTISDQTVVGIAKLSAQNSIFRRLRRHAEQKHALTASAFQSLDAKEARPSHCVH